MSITLNPYLMLLVFVTFMLLIYLLNQGLFKPMLTFMNKRDEAIAQELAEAQAHKQETVKAEEEIGSILADARKESAQILEAATKEAKAMYESRINAKKAENDIKLAQYKQELSAQKAALIDDLSSQIPLYSAILNTKLKQI